MRKMIDAPRDETKILLKHSIHGWIEAYFSKGYWTESREIREYMGSVWVCGDDLCQIDVEETIEGYDEPEALGWLELPL